jgi:hypothetical protein
MKNQIKRSLLKKSYINKPHNTINYIKILEIRESMLHKKKGGGAYWMFINC